MRYLAAAFLISSCGLLAQTYTISTFAGGGIPDNVPATAIGLQLMGEDCVAVAENVAVDAAGNVFIASGYSVFRLDRATRNVSRIAGDGSAGASSGDGPATLGPLGGWAVGLAVDAAGDNVYISVAGLVRRVSNGVITTVAGGGSSGVGDNGPATSAQLIYPVGLALDSTGALYIADLFDNRIRKVSNGVMTTVAGNGTAAFSGDNGPAISAQLSSPSSVAVDATGNLYIVDMDSHRIRKVSNGIITTVAGNGTRGFSGDGGPATNGELDFPQGVAVSFSGDLYIADGGNSRIRKVSNGLMTTVAGDGSFRFSGDHGPAVNAQLSFPQGVAVDPAGNLYIQDTSNNRIRKISNGIITTIAGNGTTYSGDNGAPTNAQISNPWAVATDRFGAVYILSDSVVRKVSNGVITTVAGNGTAGFSGDNGLATSAQLEFPNALATDPAGNIYIVEDYTRVREVSNGVITTVAGGGNSRADNVPATSEDLFVPSGIGFDDAGNLYIAEAVTSGHIREVSNGVITTLANNVHLPEGLAVDSAGAVYWFDNNGNRIFRLAHGVATSIAGNGTNGFSGDNGLATNAQLNYPQGIAVDSDFNVYIADNGRIRKISGGVITTIAGNGTAGFSGDNGPATSAQLGARGLAVDAHGNVFLADSSNGRVRVLTLNGTPLSIFNPGVLAVGMEGAAYESTQFSATGGTGGFSWTATGLPTGLKFSSTGLLTGTPASGSQGVYRPQFTVTDSTGAMASTILQLTIRPSAPFITSVNPNPVIIHVNQMLFINGGAFQNGLGLIVRLIWANGSIDLQGAQLNSFSSTQISIPFDFSIALGNWTAQVVNPDGQPSNVVFFSVIAPGVSPATNVALPQFVFGGAWYSALYFSNTTDSAATVQVAFMDDTGAPLNVPLTGIGSVSTQSVNLKAGGTAMLQAPNGGPSAQGWAEVVLPPGVTGYGVFRQVISGRADQEALVSFAPETSQAAELTYDETAFTTAVAFLNPSNQQVVVTLTAFGPDGAQVGSTQLALSPRSKQETVLTALPGMSGMSGQEGRVVFSVPSGAVSVLGLRFGGEAFTDIPVTHR